MKKEYRPWSPDQSFLLPPSPTEWLPKGHLAYFVLDLVSELDLRAIEDVIHGKDPRGTRPYSPRGIVSLCHNVLKLFRRIGPEALLRELPA